MIIIIHIQDHNTYIQEKRYKSEIIEIGLVDFNSFEIVLFVLIVYKI